MGPVRDVLPVLLPCLLLAGCLDAFAGASTFRFEAEGPGGTGHGSGTCGEEARLVGQVTGTAGAVRARVVDGAGRAVLEEDIPAGARVDRVLRGASGTWTAEVASPDLQGTFWFEMRCGDGR